MSFRRKVKRPPKFWYARFHYGESPHSIGNRYQTCSGVQYIGAHTRGEQLFYYEHGDSGSLRFVFEDGEYDEEDWVAVNNDDHGDFYMQGRGAP